MIQLNSYGSNNNYINIDKEINRCNTVLNLASKGYAISNSHLHIEEDKEKILSNHELLDKVCNKVTEILNSNLESIKRAPPQSLTNFRKLVKEFKKEHCSGAISKENYRTFKELYSALPGKLYSEEPHIEKLTNLNCINEREEFFELSYYIVSVNDEYLFLQEQSERMLIFLLYCKTIQSFIDRFGEYKNCELIVRYDDYPLSLCTLLKELEVKKGNVSQEWLHRILDKINDSFKKRPAAFRNKDDLSKFVYAILIQYISEMSKITSGTPDKRFDAFYEKGNQRHYRFFTEWTKRVLENSKNMAMPDFNTLSLEEQVEAMKILIHTSEKMLAFYKKNALIFNNGLIKTKQYYKSAIHLIQHYKNLTCTHNMMLKNINEFKKKFCKSSLPILEYSAFKEIDFDALSKSVLENPIVMGYKDIISLLEGLPEYPQFDQEKTQDVVGLQTEVSDVHSIQELSDVFTELSLQNNEILSVETPIECSLESVHKLHERNLIWFDQNQDPFKNNPRYKDKNLTDEIKKQIKLFHNFARKVDHFVFKHGVKIDDLEEYPGSSQYALPCIIKTSDIEYRGKVIYCVDKQTGVIWHRCFKENGYETFRTDYINDTIWIKDVDFPKLSDTSSKNKSKQKSAAVKKKAESIQGQALTDDGSKVIKATSTYVRISDPKNQAEIILDIE